MIQLPNVTLICVATRDIEKAIIAIEKSREDIVYGAVKLISDIQSADFPSRIDDEWYYVDTFETVDDWCKFIFYEIHKFVDTEFCFLIHPDGYVINANQWTNEFLNYDYIGAPWLPDTMFDIYGNEVRVGNSVSIRSKRLLELPSKLNLPWKPFNGSYNEDSQICCHYRPYFLGAGMTFAPVELAAKFSKEIPCLEHQGVESFAFHEWESKFATFKLEDIYAEYVNLDSRPDRNEHMVAELLRVGVKAIRRRGLLPKEVQQFVSHNKLKVMWDRTKGAVGCHYSQIAVIEEALRQNKHAWVMEDDLIYCDDIQDRLKIISDFCSNNDWDIIWLGGTYHKEATWHKSENGKHTHPDLQMCSCNLNRDWEPTDNPYIVRTYGCWSTYSYIVNRKRIPLILERLDYNVEISMGIDWLMILLQPNLNCFAFNPGCVKQMDNKSNIGEGITYFSTFQNLGEHWFKHNMI